MLLFGIVELLEHSMQHIGFEYATALRCLIKQYVQREAYWKEMYDCLYDKCMDLEERYEETMALNFQLENNIAFSPHDFPPTFCKAFADGILHLPLLLPSSSTFLPSIYSIPTMLPGVILT